MSGKYDPPDKAQLIAQFRRTPSTVELMVAAAEAQFPPKVEDTAGASRATLTESESSLMPTQARALEQRRGRKRVVTSERVQMICALLAIGESEQSACIRAGIGSTAWSVAKRLDPALRGQIASARDDWARLRHTQHATALYESQVARSAGRKALKPQPTRQAKALANYLTVRVPLHFAAIPEAEVKAACARYGMSYETWRRQEKAFGLMKKVYAKRATIRGSSLSGIDMSQSRHWFEQR